MIEIPPKFAGKPPVNPESRKKIGSQTGWKGAQGLAEDVRYYGKWMRDEAEKRIGHLYPKIEVTAEMAKERPDLKPYVGKKLTVIAWLWARTVKSPNPAFAQVDVPLASTFMLSTKAGKEAYVEPVIEGGSYRFTVKVGKPKDAEAAKNGTKLARRQLPMPDVGDTDRVRIHRGRRQSRAHGRAVDGDRRRGRARAGLPAADAGAMEPSRGRRSRCGSQMRRVAGNMALATLRVDDYGIRTFGDYLHRPPARGADDLLRPGAGGARAGEARRARRRPADDGKPLRDGGTGATAYADAVGVYLGVCCRQDRRSWLNALCHGTWRPTDQRGSHTLRRQAIPMIWDFAEVESVLRVVSGNYW